MKKLVYNFIIIYALAFIGVSFCCWFDYLHAFRHKYFLIFFATATIINVIIYGIYLILTKGKQLKD